MNHSTDNIRDVRDNIKANNPPNTNYTVIKPNRANQATGILILLILLGTFWIYGFAG